MYYIFIRSDNVGIMSKWVCWDSKPTRLEALEYRDRLRREYPAWEIQVLILVDDPTSIPHP